MSEPTWTGGAPPEQVRVTPAGWVRVVLRGAALGGIAFGGLGVLLTVRLIERPLHGRNRPWTPHITVFVCRSAVRALGLNYRSLGMPMAYPGAIVANHSSWLDIFTLNAGGPMYFVSKAEVAAWPGIGWLARATGTVFIRREAREAAAQKALFEDRLTHGHKLLFFPEGTSTDGLRVLPFKPTLFAAFYSEALRTVLHIQPVTVTYRAPMGSDARFYGWWGDMDFGSHLLKTMAASRHGEVEIVWHEPLRVADFPDRKALARACETVVRSAHVRASETAS